MQGEARPGAAVGRVQAAGHGPLLARDAAGNAAPQGPRPDLPRERAAAVCGRLVTPVQRYWVLAASKEGRLFEQQKVLRTPKVLGRPWNCW